MDARNHQNMRWVRKNSVMCINEECIPVDLKKGDQSPLGLKSRFSKKSNHEDDMRKCSLVSLTRVK